MRTRIYSIAIMMVFGAGCETTELPERDVGNEALGVARFVVDDSASRTTVIGLDAAGSEVARLELVHGRFTLSPPFVEDYDTPEVSGRKLHVVAKGQETNWETAGYDPVLHLPAPPSGSDMLVTFLDDPHAKVVLDRWQIGFDSQAATAAGENYYTMTGSYRGNTPVHCDNQTTCGTANGKTINMCGGGAAALQADKLTQVSGTNCGLYTSSYNQQLLSQCCPAGSGNQSQAWFAQKACSVATAGNCDPDGNGSLTTADGTMTSCGCQTNTAACKACPTYPAPAPGACTTGTSGPVGSCSGASVYSLSYLYDPCNYDGVCETGESNLNCAADCCTTIVCGTRCCLEGQECGGVGGNSCVWLP